MLLIDAIKLKVEKILKLVSFFCAILDFSLLLLVKLTLLILFVSFLVSVLCFFIDSSLSRVIALPTIAIALKGDSEKITVTFR